MKSGTLTTSPVSIVAGLPEPVTVAPLIDGCVSATVNSTVVWYSYTDYFSSVELDFHIRVFKDVKQIHFQRFTTGISYWS